MKTNLKIECVDEVRTWPGGTLLLSTHCLVCGTECEAEVTYEDVLKLKEYFEKNMEGNRWIGTN